jgi:carboxylesterase type B
MYIHGAQSSSFGTKIAQSAGGFYNFSNIRYAQPPLGALRFAAPVAVVGSSDIINNGSVGIVFPQMYPV